MTTESADEPIVLPLCCRTLSLLPLIAAADAQRDRQSMLGMRDEDAKDFAFDETVPLKPGYERASAMRSGASEMVIVWWRIRRASKFSSTCWSTKRRARDQALAAGLGLRGTATA